MIEDIVEIIQTQDNIQRKHFDLEIDRLVQFLDQNNPIGRKEIKEIFGEVSDLVRSLQNQEITDQYTRLYNDIFATIYLYEKDFLLKKLSVQRFIRQLDAVQQNFHSGLSSTKQVFGDLLGISLEQYFNLFELNLDLVQQDYYRNFLDNLNIFKNRIVRDIEKNIYKDYPDSKAKLYEDLGEIKSLFKTVDEILESEKLQKTQQLAEERNYCKLFNWKDDSNYLDYMNNYENNFIIDKFLGIAGQYIDWKYPVAYIDPNIGELTRHIISGDPFYVVDDRTLPYDKILESLPIESRRKIYHYKKETAETQLERSSVHLCVSWNNFGSMTPDEIQKDIALMSNLLRPGGYAIFNYADSRSIEGAKFSSNFLVPVSWKESIDRFADNNQLIEKVTYQYNEYPFSIAVYQKEGKIDELDLANKLALVLPDEGYLEQLRQEESEEYKKQRAAISQQEKELKRMHERDELLRDLDKQRKLGKNNIIESKLKNAINHLSSTLSQSNYDYRQPSVLESILHISKLTYSLGRMKDARNILKRVAQHIEKMSDKSPIAKKYREWQNFLNNIDT
jgi:hypothetical protein